MVAKSSYDFSKRTPSGQAISPEIQYNGNTYRYLEIENVDRYVPEISTHNIGDLVGNTSYLELDGVSPVVAIASGVLIYINEKYLWAYQYKKIAILTVLIGISFIYIVSVSIFSIHKKRSNCNEKANG